VTIANLGASSTGPAFAKHLLRFKYEAVISDSRGSARDSRYNSERKRSMRTESEMREAASRAFVAAFLLCGNATQAEVAVLKSIELLNGDGESGDELIRETVHAAIEPEDAPGQPPKETDPAYSMLPFELKRVLQLPRYLRQCFVLRVLLGLSREACAGLLHSKSQQVDEGASAAMVQLPAMHGTSLASVV